MSTTEPRLVIAIDPGSSKCGLAVVNMQYEALELQLVNRIELSDKLLHLLNKFADCGYVLTVVMGNGTKHKSVMAELPAQIVQEIQLVEEYGSTLAARELYWKYNKPVWWQRLLPSSWRNTPPLDAYAALVIGRRYIDMEKNN